MENEKLDERDAETPKLPVSKWQSIDWRRFGVTSAALIAVFIIGYHAKGPTKDTSNADYNTKATSSSNKKRNPPATEEVVALPVSPPQSALSAQSQNFPTGGKVAGEATPCPVKGNISGKSKIYHLPGGSFYARTQEEMCFNTEAEAKAAGFRKSQR